MNVTIQGIQKDWMWLLIIDIEALSKTLIHTEWITYLVIPSYTMYMEPVTCNTTAASKYGKCNSTEFQHTRLDFNYFLYEN